MPQPTFPLFAWGTADDISGAGYTTTGTLGALTAVTDPFGGTSAYTINDTDAGAQSARLKSGIILTGSDATLTVCWKAGTSAGYVIVLRDTTAGSVRIQDNGTQSAGVPTQNMATGTGYTPVPLGNSWYCFRYRSSAIVSGNTHRLELYGTANVAANTGSSLWYVRPMALVDYLIDPVSGARPRIGYEALETPGGARDAWSYGDEEFLQGRVPYIPDYPRDFPVSVSGWYGQAESAGVNSSVKAMLSAGWRMDTVRFVPDRSVCTTYVDSYLTQPKQDFQPTREKSGDRTFQLELTSPSTVFTGF